MDQISPPMRIVLAVAVVFLAAYMLVLRPKDEVAPAPAPATAPAADAGGAPANTSLGKAVEGANDAAAATEAAQDESSGETQSNAPSTTQAAPAGSADEPAPAKPATKPEDAALADLPEWLRTSIDKKVVAFLFTNGKSADDRRTSRNLQKAYVGDGQVVTRVVNVKKISAYEAVAKGLDVSQSPTLMVIARDRTAQAYPGFSSRTSINQAIIDAMLATSDPSKTVPFLKTLQAEGKQIITRDIVGVTAGTTIPGALKNYRSTLDLLDKSVATIKKADAPKPYRDLKSEVLRYLESEQSIGNRVIGMVQGDDSISAIDLVAVNKAVRSNDKLMRSTLLDLNAVGVDSFN